MNISWNADQVDKDAENHGKIRGNHRRNHFSCRKNEPWLLSANSLPILCQGLSFPSFLVWKKKTHTTVFLMMHLGKRKLSLLRKKNVYKPFRKKRFRFHVIKLIRCDRTRQRSITIINKEKSFTPNNSPLSHYSLLIFCSKESSRRDLSEHVKISFRKKWHFFPWLIPNAEEDSETKKFSLTGSTAHVCVLWMVDFDPY